MSGKDAAGSLEAFGKGNGLKPGLGGPLPSVGTALGHGNQVDGAVHGNLPGGIEGALAHLHYEERRDDTTRTERLTAVITRISETMGFAPYLSGGSSGHINLTLESEQHEIGGVQIRAAAGVDPGWLNELISPSVADWLSRSPNGFGFELADGVLTVVVDGHETSGAKLTRLCEDAAFIANALREESIEEASSGQAKRSAAKRERNARDRRVEHLLPYVDFSRRRPAHVADAIGPYQDVARRAPVTYVGAAWTAFLITLVISVISSGIYGLLLTVGDPLRNALIWELGLFVVVFFFTLRSRINGDAKACAEEAFYREYAAERDLTLSDPLEFAAVHAEADLPGKPARVLSGAFSGPSGTVVGALALTGDGLERGQHGSLIAGLKGPTATAELDVAQPGISAAYLDELTQTLLLDLATAPAESRA
jgi:hypothetical protein